MAIATREAEVVWEGSLASGTGTLLIAAAHASCFAMALSLSLDEHHATPQRVSVQATCRLDEVDGAPRITAVQLSARARVPGLERSSFDEIVERAAALCPVPDALRGTAEIDVTSQLEV